MIVLTDEVNLSQVILVLLNTFLPVLFQHVIVILQLWILTLREIVASAHVRGRRMLHPVVRLSMQVLLAAVVLKHRVTLCSYVTSHTLVTTAHRRTIDDLRKLQSRFTLVSDEPNLMVHFRTSQVRLVPLFNRSFATASVKQIIAAVYVAQTLGLHLFFRCFPIHVGISLMSHCTRHAASLSLHADSRTICSKLVLVL